ECKCVCHTSVDAVSGKRYIPRPRPPRKCSPLCLQHISDKYIHSPSFKTAVYPDKLPSSLYKCSPNPCQNRALCRARGDSYSCFCVPGFQGAHCQINVNECVSQPCQHGGTCLDRVGTYACLCPPGFTGLSCEVDVDECHSQPCANGGSCHDDAGGFSCTCPPGFHGDQCQINTDECQDEPCHNGALCVDGVNEYSCDCSSTAFTGAHCDVPLPACHSQPCFNSAICQDSPGNYSCHCWPGFEGRQCETDIPECSSAPCLHGGRCVERSWRALYGTEPLLPLRYNPHNAEGFVCSCPNGTTGSLCQEVMDQCSPSPCQNGGTCETFVGGYTCHCPRHNTPSGVLYGGANCEERLVGCEGHKCQNHGWCAPFLLDGTHGYTCTCTAGFTGPLCKTPTSFSFERRGYLLLQSPLVETEVSVNVTLSFKTVLPRALLFQRNSRGLLLILSLLAGRLRLTLTKETSAGALSQSEQPSSQVLELPHNVTDGQWHSVEATLGNWVLSLKLLDLARSSGAQAYHKVAPVQIPAEPIAPPQNTYIGGVLEQSDSRSPAFIGCMRDVLVDWQLVVPEEWLSNSAVNVSPGCSHRDRCLDTPCQNGGECVNLWQSYQCRCPRPYKGQDCEEEHVIARFGNEDAQSYAAFTISDNITDHLSLSLFLRTRRSNCLLLAVPSNNTLSLTVWLEDGRVQVQLHSSDVIKSARAVDDGEVHFVSLELAGGRMTLYIQGERQGHVDVSEIMIQAGDSVLVGGLAERGETAAFGGYLKGCVQDLRINEERLQFFGLDTSVRSYPLVQLDNVTAGCSGDNKCSRNPCLNGGMCFSVWDDFSCSCPPAPRGVTVRRCAGVSWPPVPPEPICSSFPGYANATFLNDSTVLTYRGNGRISRNITSLSLNLRTRKRNAAILHAEKASSFITLSVQEGYLFLELQSIAESDMAGNHEARQVSTVSLSSRSMISDGEWHSVHLFMATPWMLTSRWTLVLDDEIELASASKGQAGNLDFLREGVDIFLGGLAPDAGWALAGCLSTVELGGIALSYLSTAHVNLPRLQPDQFALMSLNAPLLGCSGASVCWPNPCLNGGQCQDLFNWFNCSCVGGWAGRRCDLFVNACASDPCHHGNCSVQGLSYECSCELGYAGVDCEEEVDVCEKHLCANGATCLHGPRAYSCLCPDNYTGPLCSERVAEIPWYMIVKTVRSKLPVSVCGDNLKNYTCFNGGNCTQRELSCDCPSGFTGHRCEQEVDECKSNPCLNGGYCRNLANRFACVCDMSFAGDVCEIDLTAQGLTSGLLLSLSLLAVVLVLLLVLTSVGLVVALNRRATHGTYSPSRQEKEGSRVEMWSITQPPPMERLI
uniref:Crumbs cell polarity complex component 1 n=1 Tax=Neogobius melanostomus TaxID=47308 RepID=A0A8C6T4S2_9GOBI